jgi:hypothetical protein
MCAWLVAASVLLLLGLLLVRGSGRGGFLQLVIAGQDAAVLGRGT